MVDQTAAHTEKETLAVEVNIPAHDARVTTPLFEHTKKLLEEREGGKCYISGKTAADAGPLHAHHYPVERCLAEAVDWQLFAALAKLGQFGPHPAAFDWAKFFEGATEAMTTPYRDAKSGAVVAARKVIKPKDPYLFVDDMTVNGMLLAAEFHTGKDSGIHIMPHPLWIAQMFLMDGYQYTPTEIISHGDNAK